MIISILEEVIVKRDIPGFEDEQILYATMEFHSRYFNLYDFVKNGLPQQIHDADLYTLDEVAEITKMSIVTIRQYVRTGKLKAIKQWKNWMVSSNEIARLLYEKLHGVKLDEGTVMLAVIAGDLYEEESIISDYKIITANDLLTHVDREKIPKSIDNYMKILVPDAQFIEAIANIENFFRRTNNLQGNSLKDTELPLDEFISPSPFDKRRYFIENSNDLLSETPKEALQTIRKHFGPLDEELTLLKMYRLMLMMSTELKENIDNKS